MSLSSYIERVSRVYTNSNLFMAHVLCLAATDRMRKDIDNNPVSAAYAKLYIAVSSLSPRLALIDSLGVVSPNDFAELVRILEHIWNSSLTEADVDRYVDKLRALNHMYEQLKDLDARRTAISQKLGESL